MKKTSSFLLGWQRKYCLVAEHKFKYYKDKELTKLGGVFDFQNLDCIVAVDDGDETDLQAVQKGIKRSEPTRFRIEITGSHRIFLFEA